jgi:hypothetical protein
LFYHRTKWKKKVIETMERKRKVLFPPGMEVEWEKSYYQIGPGQKLKRKGTELREAPEQKPSIPQVSLKALSTWVQAPSHPWEPNTQ